LVGAASRGSILPRRGGIWVVEARISAATAPDTPCAPAAERGAAASTPPLPQPPQHHSH
jgi:hypothetical protein